MIEDISIIFLFGGWLCIYYLPLFENLVCDRHIAEGYFQFLDIIKCILTCGKLYIISNRHYKA